MNSLKQNWQCDVHSGTIVYVLHEICLMRRQGIQADMTATVVLCHILISEIYCLRKK